MSQAHILTIDSSDRISGTSTDFVVNINTLYEVTHVKLAAASIPNTEFNLVNQSIHFNEGGPALVANLVDGAYSITDLLVEIAARMNAVGALTYTITYSASLFRLVISATGPFAISQANTVLGLQPAASAGNAVVGYYAIKLHIPKVWFIRIKELAAAFCESSGGAYGNFILHSKVNSAYIDQYSANSDFNQAQLYQSQNLNQLSITLFDSTGQVVDLQGSDWSMTLKLKYAKTL